MMDFSPARLRRKNTENIVPMINVVFLLLIFFLMSARIVPPPPFDVTLPASETDSEPPHADRLYVSDTGALYFNGARDDAALARLASLHTATPLFIQADAALQASQLADLLPKLGAAGISEIRLVTGGE